MRLPRFSRLLLLVVFSGLLAAPSLPAQVLTGYYDGYDIFPGQNLTARSFTCPLVVLWGDCSLTLGTGTSNSNVIEFMELGPGASLILNARADLQIQGVLISGDNVRITLTATPSALTLFDGSYGVFDFLHSDAVVTLNSRTRFYASDLRLGYGLSTDALNNQMIVTGAGAQLRVQNDFVVGWAAINSDSGQLHQGEGTLTVQNGGEVVAMSGLILARGGSSSGTLNIGAYDLTNPTTAGTVTSSSVTLAGGDGVINFNQTDATTFTAAISGIGQIVQRGTGTTTLSGANTYLGTTTVSAGTLALAGSGTLGSSTVYLQNGATLDLGGTTQTVAGVGDLDHGSVGNITAGTINTNGYVVLQSGTFANTFTGSGDNARLWIGGDANATVTLNGTNDMVFTENDDHNQVIIGFHAPGGTVLVGNANALAAATENVHLFSGTLDLNGVADVRANSITLQYGAGTALVNHNTASTASFGGSVAVETLTGVIGGEGDLLLSGQVSGEYLNKIGDGTLTLTGAASFINGTAIAGGTLEIGHGGTTGSIGGTIANDATLIFNRSDASTFSDSITGSGSVTVTGGGTLTLSGENTYSGGTTVSAGTLVAGHASAFGTGTVRVDAGTLDLGGYAISNALDLRGGALTGLAHYTGTQTVRSAASYNGTVGGALVVATGGSVNTTDATFTGNLTVQNGATLSGTGAVNFATLASGATLAPGNSPGTLTFTNGLTLDAGAIIDFELGTTSDLIRVSGGTLTGPTSGTITLNLSDAGGFTAASYTLFDFSGATASSFDASDFTLGSIISGYTYQFSLVGSTLQLVATASAVPEPATYAAILGALTFALAAWRRRKGALSSGRDSE